MSLTAVSLTADLVARLPRELVLSVTYLYGQGGHLLLCHNAPGTEQHKRPAWQAWQLPQNRPTLQQCLEHLANGGLIGLVPHSLGLAVIDIDEGDKDGIADWNSRYPPLGDVPSEKPGHTHLYYNSTIPYHNRNKFRLGSYGITVEVRSRHGLVILWDASAVAEIVAERSMVASTRGMTRLPRTVLGLRPSMNLWPSVVAIQGLQEPPQRQERPRPRGRPRMSRRAFDDLPPAPEAWTLPDPPDYLRGVPKGNRNNSVFDAARIPVYKLARGHGGEAMRVRWYALVLDYVDQCNGMLPVSMRPARVQSTAKSIARFTWASPTYGRIDVMGWRDPEQQRERGRASGRARRERNRPRNARIMELHHAGWSRRRIAFQEGVSRTTVWRVVAEDRDKPGMFHEPIAAPGRDFELGLEIRGNDENRNNRAANLLDETSSQPPDKRLQTVEITQYTDEITLSDTTSPTPSVDNSGGGVDNWLSPWEEAIRQGERRRAEESRRWAERERRIGWDRGPPEE